MKKGPRSPAAAAAPPPGDTPGQGGAVHPEPSQLVDHVEGHLAPAVARSVRSHLRTCAPCAATAKAFTQLVRALEAERTERPPHALSDWARALPESVPRSRTAPGAMSARAPRDTGMAVALRRGVAGALRLVADSWNLVAGSLGAGSLAPVPALRSADARATSLGRRRLLFAAQGFDLDLEVDYVGQADPRRLHGQLLPVEGSRAEWQGSEIHLTRAGRSISHARVDRRGEFRLPRVQPGRYRLEIRRSLATRPAALPAGRPTRGPARAGRCASPVIEV